MLSISFVLLGGIATLAQAVIPIPTVTGPLASDPHGSASRNYTFFATDLDLRSRGYVEQEFFYSGTANVYTTPNLVGGIGLGAAATTASIVSSGHPYKTRMVVRRPTNDAQFNGTVVVEWLNTTGQFDVEALWFRDHEFFIRDGYAWIGISIQDQGISRAPNGLKLWSPARYGTLDVTDSGKVGSEGLSYDVLAQGMQAVRSVPAVMGGLLVRRIIASGVSQSAGRLALYLNTVHPRDPIADAALLIIGGQQVRPDLSIPVMKVLSETEYAGPASANQVCSSSAPPAPCGTSLQPDTDKFRLWGMAGVSHSDWESGIVRNAIARRDLPLLNLYDTCTSPSRSRIQDQYILAAAVAALDNWVARGVAPPIAPSIQMATTSPVPTVVRDANGNVLGGIRLASFAVPVATDTGLNGGPGVCFLNGTHIPFDTPKLQALYPTHEAYVNLVTQATFQNVRDGFLLSADADEMIADASSTTVGSNVICGPLCANVAQFPLNPSTSNLRDQTEFFYMVGGENLLAIMDQATQLVAQGYTAAANADVSSQVLSKQAFGNAVGSVKTYINVVKEKAARGEMAPETMALLVDFASTLIERIVFEAKLTDPMVGPGADGSIRIVEFYRAQSQQYFLAADLFERASLDKGGAGGDWTRNGYSFMGWQNVASAPASTVPVCRFFGTPGSGPNTHYYTAVESECTAMKADSRWTYEGIGFRALPTVNGACPAGTTAVTRLFKAGTTLAALRFRFIVDPVRIATMKTFDGWTLEGPVFCAPPSP